MRRAALAAIALAILVAVPAAQAAASGARTPISADGNAVNDVAVAATAGRFAAGTQDPGSTLTATAGVAVWHLWNLDGSLRQQGKADPIPDCPQPPLGSPERCQTDVKAVAVSADGARIAVGSTARNGGQSYLFFFRDTGAMAGSPISFGNADWNGLAMDSAGQVVAVALAANTGDPTDPEDGILAAYDFLTGNQRFRVDTPSAPLQTPAAAVDVSPSGSLVVGAAGSHFRFNTFGTTSEDSNIQGDPKAVDASGHSDLWSVAGYDSGFFALYSGFSQPSVAEYQKREATDGSGIQAVAIRDSATAFATGNSAGRIRLYSLDPDTESPNTAVALLAEKTGLGSVTAMAFSADGRYLAAITGGTVRFYYTGNGLLEEMWSDARTGLVPTALAVDGRGEHVVVAVGTTVVVYDAVHKLVASVPTATQQAGTNVTYDLSFRNDGNRVDVVGLTPSPPSGVTVAITPQVTLQPGATQGAEAKVTIPATWPPGALSIPIRQSINGGADGTPSTTMAITVPTVHQVTLTAVGPDSRGASRGGPAVFDVLAKNTGNVQETVTLSVSGLPARWTSQVTPATVTLLPGASANLTVGIQAPSDARDGSRATGTLGGGAATPLQLTATVGASFAVHVTGPIGVVVQPGVTGNITATVRNDGNTLDSAVVRLSALPAGWLGGFLNGQAELTIDDLEPGETEVVTLSLRAPADYSSSVPVQVTIVGTSVGDTSKTSTARTLVTVAQPQTSTSDDGDGEGGNGIPGPAPVVLLAMLALAAVAMRRRR